MIKKTNLKTISLFTGAGGLDIGFHTAGIDIVATVEIDHACCETLRANALKFSPHSKIIEGDITKLKAEDIYPGKVDLFIGGPPCQAFSAIGRRAGGALGTMDNRGTLFEHYCRLLKAYNPSAFLFENVRGILSSHQGKDWARILEAFEALGYTLRHRILDTAGFGVAQHRERMILVGFKKGNFQFPRPVTGPDANPPSDYPSPSRAIAGLKLNTERLFSKGGKYDHLISAIPPGTNYLFYTREMNHPKPCFAWRSKFSDFLYKAHPDRPVKTIVARLGRYSGPFHWDGRRLHVSELKRLQGFPDDYNIVGSDQDKLKQIGNSVCPPFAYQLARAVKKTIFGISENIEVIDESFRLSFDSRKGAKARQTRSLSKQNSLSNNQLDLFNGSQGISKISPANKSLLPKRVFLRYSTAFLCDFLPDKTKDAWKLEIKNSGRT